MPTVTVSRNVFELRARLDGHLARIHGREDEAFRNVCFSAFGNIIVGGKYAPGTPVDLGFARNSWVTGVNAPGEAQQPRQPPPSNERKPINLVAFRAMQAALVAAKLGDIVYLTSNCVYMNRLEYGHSGQAPAGMIRLTVAAAPEIVRDVVTEMAS